MAYMLAPIKSAVTNFSKSLPDVVMAEEIDFETWGHKFMVAVVSYRFALIIMDPNSRFIE
jgi:hypothetical protein